MDSVIYNAIKLREKRGDIENEISVIPFFRDIFTSETSLIGNRGQTIKALRTNHRAQPKKYKGRKKYNI